MRPVTRYREPGRAYNKHLIDKSDAFDLNVSQKWCPYGDVPAKHGLLPSNDRPYVRFDDGLNLRLRNVCANEMLGTVFGECNTYFRYFLFLLSRLQAGRINIPNRVCAD